MEVSIPQFVIFACAPHCCIALLCCPTSQSKGLLCMRHKLPCVCVKTPTGTTCVLGQVSSLLGRKSLNFESSVPVPLFLGCYSSASGEFSIVRVIETGQNKMRVSLGARTSPSVRGTVMMLERCVAVCLLRTRPAGPHGARVQSFSFLTFLCRLCASCDELIHKQNKLVSRHIRVPLNEVRRAAFLSTPHAQTVCKRFRPPDR